MSFFYKEEENYQMYNVTYTHGLVTYRTFVKTKDLSNLQKAIRKQNHISGPISIESVTKVEQKEW